MPRTRPNSLPTAALALLAGLALLTSGLARAATDWPQWRGPGRDGRAASTGLLGTWPEGGPPLAWRATGLGSGFSSVAVADGRVYTMGDLGDAQYVIALRDGAGTLLWKREIGPAWKDELGGPRSTPTVDGERVFVVSTEGDVIALAAATGELLWKRSLPEEFGARLMKADGTYDWKFSESPLVDGNRVVVTPGVPKAALVALDKESGKEIWRSEIPALGERGDDGAGYSSVVVSNGAGTKQYVQLLGRGVIGVEAETGKFLWGYNRIANDVANIPTPIVAGHHVFVSTGYGTGSALLRLKKTGHGVGVEEVYFLDAETMQNHHGGMILDDGHVYTGTGHNKGFPLAVELATGKVAWGPVRNAGKSSAAIAWADDRLYFRYQDGRVILVEATPETYREHGSFMIPGVTQPSWPHPVIANGRLYLREQDTLYVYDVRAEKG